MNVSVGRKGSRPCASFVGYSVSETVCGRVVGGVDSIPSVGTVAFMIHSLTTTNPELTNPSRWTSWKDRKHQATTRDRDGATAQYNNTKRETHGCDTEDKE